MGKRNIHGKPCLFPELQKGVARPMSCYIFQIFERFCHIYSNKDLDELVDPCTWCYLSQNISKHVQDRFQEALETKTPLPPDTWGQFSSDQHSVAK